MASNQHHEIDVQRLVSSMETTLSSGGFSMCSRTCIFPTPNILLRHNRKAYFPTAFSIGPLHHRKAYLKRTEKIKLKYLQDLVSRTGVALKDLVAAVAEIEAKSREHYAERVDFGPEELVRIMVLDGCFLIEFFRKNSRNVESVVPEPDDPVFTMSCMFQHLSYDLVLLENQIPWIVLDRLFTLTSLTSLHGPRDRSGPSNPIAETPLAALVFEFFYDILPTVIDSETLQHKISRGVTSRHILELIRDLLISTSTTESWEGEKAWPPIPSTTELETAGITLRKSSSAGLDIYFEDGVLYVSPITIQETTEALFRNIISFEQCSPNCPPVFTSYAILLDNLINTPEDVNRLSREEIVNNWLNPEDATNFFNKLYHDTYVKDFYYPRLCSEVKSYTKRSWPTWRAALVRNYFTNPWVIASTCAAIFLLVLTFLQTYYSIKG